MVTGGVASFLDLTQETVRRFLQTVVIMDDEATYDVDKITRYAAPSLLNAPGRVGESANEANTLEKPLVRTNLNELDAQVIVDAFADQGLVCAVIKPFSGEGNTIKERITCAAQRADILVLDWDVNGTKGETACEVIKALVTDVNKDRLRLIAIYTAEPGSAAIIEVIRAALQLNEAGALDDQYTINYYSCRIVVYAKNGVGGGEREVPEGSLPNRLLRDFASMTTGLLSNVTLLSLAAVRDNTHRMLTKFTPELDAPFLTHRALTTQPNDADVQLIPLVIMDP